MGLGGGESDSGAKSGRVRFGRDLSQEDFDREFFGSILRTERKKYGRRQTPGRVACRDMATMQNALRLDRLLTERQPEDPVVHYNLACSLSMSGELNLAVAALARALELGYSDFAHIQADPDLDPLRELSSFGELLRRRIPDDEPPLIA